MPCETCVPPGTLSACSAAHRLSSPPRATNRARCSCKTRPDALPPPLPLGDHPRPRKLHGPAGLPLSLLRPRRHHPRRLPGPPLIRCHGSPYDSDRASRSCSRPSLSPCPVRAAVRAAVALAVVAMANSDGQGAQAEGPPPTAAACRRWPGRGPPPPALQEWRAGPTCFGPQAAVSLGSPALGRAGRARLGPPGRARMRPGSSGPKEPLDSIANGKKAKRRPGAKNRPKGQAALARAELGH